MQIYTHIHTEHIQHTHSILTHSTHIHCTHTETTHTAHIYTALIAHIFTARAHTHTHTHTHSMHIHKTHSTQYTAHFPQSQFQLPDLVTSLQFSGSVSF